MKNKLVAGILILIVLLLEVSTSRLIATNDGTILGELTRVKKPEIYIDSFDPHFRGFTNGSPITVWEEKLVSRVVISPTSKASNIGQGIVLNSSIREDWVTGIDATGRLSEDTKEIFLKSVENINNTGVLVLAFLSTDIEILNESLFCDERTRIVVDEILRFAEEVGDASIILTGNYCTAMNLVYLLWLAEEDRRVGEVYLVILTHGVLNETLQIHGMLMHGENNVAVVNGKTLEHLAKKLRIEYLNRLKFVYLPFCNMGREKEIYGNSSVVAFFEKFSDAQILTYEGETYLNGDYIASVQSVLSAGTYELIEEHVYLPVEIIDNFTGEIVEGYIEFRVVDKIEETNSTINPYEIYDGNDNVTLGLRSRFKRRVVSRRAYKVTLHRKNVKVVIHRGDPPKSYVKRRVKHVSYEVVSKRETFGARGSKISFKHKYESRGIPVVAGRFWKPPKNERKCFGDGVTGKIEASVVEVRKVILLVDEIFDTIYKYYYDIKSAVYRWIDETFNAPWNKWIRSPVKTTLDNTVFRGANFVISFAKRYLKTIVSVAYSMVKAGKALSGLVAALIIAAIAKCARGILKYFSWTMDKLLGVLSKVLGVDLS